MTGYYKPSRFTARTQSIKAMLECPLKFQHWADGNGEYNETDSQSLGKAIHLLALEPARSNEVVLEPSFDRRTKIGKEGYQAFVDGLQPDCIVLDARDYNKAHEIAETLKPVIDSLSPVGFEIEHRWPIGDTGITGQVKFDILTKEGFADLKTTYNASRTGFKESAIKYMYDIQMVWYTIAWLNSKNAISKLSLYKAFESVCTNQTLYMPEYIYDIARMESKIPIVAIETHKPYAHAIYTIHESDLIKSVEEIVDAIKSMVTCNKANHYPSYEGGVLRLGRM
jgi:hypothetical protein